MAGVTLRDLERYGDVQFNSEVFPVGIGLDAPVFVDPRKEKADAHRDDGARIGRQHALHLTENEMWRQVKCGNRATG